MKIILTSFTLLFFQQFAAQISPAQKVEIDSILQEFDQKGKNTFLALIPNINYNPLENTFQVGFSFSNLTNFLQQKKRNKIEFSRLKLQLQEKAIRENEILESKNAILETNFLEFQIELQNYTIEASNFSIYFQLFEIQAGKHKAKEITTEDFLRSKLQFSNQFQKLYFQLEKLNLQAKKLASQINMSEFIAILDFQKNQILQMAKNSGVLGAAPL